MPQQPDHARDLDTWNDWEDHPDPTSGRDTGPVEHTPGPWTFDPDTWGIYATSANHEFDYKSDYCVGTVDVAVYNARFDDDATHEANGRLQAAAPELLEACRAARDQLMLLHARISGDLDVTFQTSVAIQRLTLAIAKATSHD